MVNESLAKVHSRIKEAAGKVERDPRSVKLIVVTKEATLDQMREAVESGITDIGENRVKDTHAKKEIFDSHVLIWHMIGHLQSNKAKEAVKLFSVIHSVDSLKLAYVIDKEAKKLDKVQDVLVEVSVTGEKSKFGLKPNALDNFLKETKHLKHIRILGLMTMAPFTDDENIIRSCFKKLKELRDRYKLKELSMGMTQDFEIAIEEGATMVRIGSAIFRSA